MLLKAWVVEYYRFWSSRILNSKALWKNMTLPLHYHGIFVQCVLILNCSENTKISIVRSNICLSKTNHGRGQIVYSYLHLGRKKFWSDQVSPINKCILNIPILIYHAWNSILINRWCVKKWRDHNLWEPLTVYTYSHIFLCFDRTIIIIHKAI